MKFKMKRKYIIPEMNVESFSASSSILAGSPNQTGDCLLYTSDAADD